MMPKLKNSATIFALPFNVMAWLVAGAVFVAITAFLSLIGFAWKWIQSARHTEREREREERERERGEREKKETDGFQK